MNSTSPSADAQGYLESMMRAGQDAMKQFEDVLASATGVRTEASLSSDRPLLPFALIVDFQREYLKQVWRLWNTLFLQSFLGGAHTDAALAKGDKRFKDASWREQPYYDLLKQTYLLGSKQLHEFVDRAQVDDKTKLQLRFYARQFIDAMSPSNFPATNPEDYGTFTRDIAEMHRLRYRVFKERLDWDVQVSGDLEIDEFDALHPAYLLQRANDGRVQGCVRLLPSSGPTMLGETFPIILDGGILPASKTIWESSRFALDLTSDAPKASHGLAVATYELFAGMIEFGLSRRLTEIVTVTDARMERILRRAGWPLRRIGEPRALGATLAVAGYLEVSAESLARVCGAGCLQGPVLWAPVALVAA